MKFQRLNEWLIENQQKGVTVLYPGGFKPLTGAHISLIEKYAYHPDVDMVKVIVGLKERDDITQDVALNIASEIASKYPKVTVERSNYPSPILTAYKYMESAEPGIYTLASSTKGKDYERVKNFVNEHQPSGKYYHVLPEYVEVVELPIDVTSQKYLGRNDEYEGKPISASVARMDIKNNDYDNFITNYPQLDENTIRDIWNKVKRIVSEAAIPGDYSDITPEDRYKSLFVEDENDEKDPKEDLNNEKNEDDEEETNIEDDEEELELPDEEVDEYISEINKTIKLMGFNIKIPYDYDIFPARKEVNRLERNKEFKNSLRLAQSSPNIGLSIGYIIHEPVDEHDEYTIEEHAWNLDPDGRVMDKTLGYSDDTYLGRKIEEENIDKIENEEELQNILRKETRFKVNESLKSYDKKKALFAGGGAGHMKNIWEATDLTFKDLKNLIEDTFSGNLKNVSEKLDGQNLMLTWKDGEMKAGRNKGQLKNFGENALNIQRMSEYFEGRGSIQKAFTETVRDLENAMKSIKYEPENIFNDGKYWINIEILYPDTENIIPYGDSQIRIHNIREIDESGKTINVYSHEKLDKLTDELERTQLKQDKTFLIKKTNKITIKNIENSNKLAEDLIVRIEELQSEKNIKDNKTIQDYIDSEIEKYIEEIIPSIPDEVKHSLINRWAKGIKKPAINKLTKGLDKETIDVIRKKDKNVKNIIKQIIWPIEKIILNLGTTILNNLEGLASSDPNETTRKIQDKVNKTIEKLNDIVENEPHDTEKINKISEFLGKQLERLEESGGIDYIAPTEGVVFEYKGKFLKLTGNFGPINQIIGYLKFNR